MLKFRQAELTDIPYLAVIKSNVWADEISDPAQMASALRLSDHVTTLVFEDDQPAGFADGFLTGDEHGDLRWELNLLAVLPEYRGRGLASRLIQENLQCAAAWTPKTSRALIRVDNIGSERSFTRCGFAPDDFISGLYLWSNDNNAMSSTENHGTHLIPVETLSYRGIWVEGKLSPAGFEAAKAACVHHNGQLAGAIIPLHHQEAIESAEQAGYTHIENYRFWWLYF